MKVNYLLISLLILISSCKEKGQGSGTQNVVITKTDKKQKGNSAPGSKESTVTLAKANATVQFQVSGMVCKMGCGGAIKKELVSTGAVEFVDVSFEEDQPSQTIVVYYDSKKTDPVKLTERIELINDGDFSVVGVRKESFDAQKLKTLMK